MQYKEIIMNESTNILIEMGTLEWKIVCVLSLLPEAHYVFQMQGNISKTDAYCKRW